MYTVVPGTSRVRRRSRSRWASGLPRSRRGVPWRGPPNERDHVGARVNQLERIVDVTELITKRVDATTATECFDLRGPPLPERDDTFHQPFAVCDRGAGRPTKRDRPRGRPRPLGDQSCTALSQRSAPPESQQNQAYRQQVRDLPRLELTARSRLGGVGGQRPQADQGVIGRARCGTEPGCRSWS